MNKRGMGSHQSAKRISDEWLTPPEIIKDLGPFDLDPCVPVNRPWDTAKLHYTREDDGLFLPWNGFVWMNAPYSELNLWLARLALHNNGIALIFARTETRMWFNYVWPAADSMLFLQGRLYFYYVDGTQAKSNGGAPSVLVAYGKQATERLKQSTVKGKFVQLKHS